MKKLAAIFVFVLVCAFAFAQENYQDVVYLKNGSVIRGLIIEQIPNKSIKVQTADRSVFVYQIDEVEKMTKEVSQPQSVSPKVKKESRHGYLLLIENSAGLGTGDYGMNMEKFSIINGYRFNPYISLGIGTGIRYGTLSNYDVDFDNFYLPVFADFRVNFINRKVTPYISLDLGSVYNLSDSDEDPGVFFNPTIGVKFKFTQRMGLNIGVGYDLQTISCYSSNYYYDDPSDEVSGTVCFNIGFSF